MVKIPESVQNIVEHYVQKIDKQITIKKAILFGSYAKGNYDTGSDVDIAIFSDYFDDMEDVEAFKYLYMQTLDYDIDLQPLAFTNEDYEKAVGIVDEIRKHGIEVKGV
ncbi:nucleotidyltransferase domain-containing protein [Schnuerera sp.]|uniref:nucleotidyltransferase domain-containing protein n=1 Tax=Schnuerera sp. TaxID=2794844 RepID=UPI002BEE3E62|nr:nucleotidyltransferase domain-containing protein [Schnuerera sp.]HSH35959.1 nucleotidyltransferase domain-containing protein [Schnuerera sp.]